MALVAEHTEPGPNQTLAASSLPEPASEGT